MQLAVAAFVFAMFSMVSFELAHTRSLTSQECNTACLSHSQAGSVLTNVNKLKKTDNEPRPPAYPLFNTNLAVFVLVIGMTIAVLAWVKWYDRRMLISTQLRF